MTNVMIQSAALDKVKELKLDQHEHSFFSLTTSKTWKCNEGNIHTREVCEVIANYTAKSMFDLSYVAYRIMNAVKAIINRSDWQKMFKTVVVNQMPGLGNLKGHTSYQKLESRMYNYEVRLANNNRKTLLKALDLNWKSGEAVKLEEPKECERKNIILH